MFHLEAGDSIEGKYRRAEPRYKNWDEAQFGPCPYTCYLAWPRDETQLVAVGEVGCFEHAEHWVLGGKIRFMIEFTLPLNWELPDNPYEGHGWNPLLDLLP